MKLLSSLETLEELIDEAKTAPFSQKILVDPEEIGQLIEQIKKQVPEEIKDAAWIKEESERIIKEAQTSYEKIIRDAEIKAAELVEMNDITMKAKERAAAIVQEAENKSTSLKFSTYKYIEGVMQDMQNRLNKVKEDQINGMYASIENAFGQADAIMNQNIQEVKQMEFMNSEVDQSNSNAPGDIY